VRAAPITTSPLTTVADDGCCSVVVDVWTAALFTLLLQALRVVIDVSNSHTVVINKIDLVLLIIFVDFVLLSHRKVKLFTLKYQQEPRQFCQKVAHIPF